MEDKYVPLEAASVWEENATHCSLCAKRLGMRSLRRRRHHCRACGKCVCSTCSPHQLPVRGLASVQRVCEACKSNAIECPPCVGADLESTILPCGHTMLTGYVRSWGSSHSEDFPCPLCASAKVSSSIAKRLPPSSTSGKVVLGNNPLQAANNPLVDEAYSMSDHSLMDLIGTNTFTPSNEENVKECCVSSPAEAVPGNASSSMLASVNLHDGSRDVETSFGPLVHLFSKPSCFPSSKVLPQGVFRSALLYF